MGLFGWFGSNPVPTDHVDEIVGLARAEQDRQAVDHNQRRRAARREEESYQSLWRVEGELHTTKQELMKAQAHIKHLEVMVMRLAADRISLVILSNDLIDQSSSDEAERGHRYEEAQNKREQLATARMSNPYFIDGWSSTKLQQVDLSEWMPHARHIIGT